MATTRISQVIVDTEYPLTEAETKQLKKCIEECVSVMSKSTKGEYSITITSPNIEK